MYRQPHPRGVPKQITATACGRCSTDRKMWYPPGVESSAPILEAEPISPREKKAQASTAAAADWLTHPTNEAKRGMTLAQRLAAEPEWQDAEDSTEEDECHQRKCSQ